MTTAPPPETNRLPTEANAAIPPKSSWLGQTLAALGAILSLIYLANFDAGIWELIPDIIPGIGNIDEVLFTLLLVFCLRKLGIDLMPHLLRPRNN
jgi:uncharacterized membrane protein YkvA (DUF1232 family)